MFGTIILLGIWIGAIVLIAQRREANRETKEHHVVKRDFDEFHGELWPRITCSCRWSDEGVPMIGTWAAKLEAKKKMNKHIRQTKKKVPTEW